jgi:AAA family ATP:ADP antiporter
MAAHSEHTSGFSRARHVFWPIHGYEVKKFLPMAIMMFFILFNYTILRNTKDALIVTSSGPEVIPFLKGMVILPFSIVIVTMYAKLSNILSRENLFYVTLGSFLAIYLLFIFVLYPNRAVLQMSPEKIQALKTAYPNIQHIFPLVGNWCSTLFYLFAELWGATILTLLFWQFANEITRVYEARRFYAMFGLIGHLALIVAGIVGQQECELQRAAENSADAFQNFLRYIILCVTGSGLIIMGIYRWMNRRVLTDPLYYDHADLIGSPKDEKPKMSLSESFRYVMSSKYLGFIAVMVLGYGMCMNLTGIMWKKQVQMQYPSSLEYANFMSGFSIWIGVITMSLIFFSKGIVERFGWYKGAIMTPIILLSTIVPFFAFMFFREATTPLVSWMAVTPLMTAVIIGAAQQILSKSAKYSMFDPTKEMAYIPLDQELKVKGKAAVDVTGYSFAKACGGYVSGALLIIFAAADLMTIAPYLAFIVLGMIVFWWFAVKQLSQLYYRLVNRGHLDEEPTTHPTSDGKTVLAV